MPTYSSGQLEDGKATFVADDGLPVDQAGAHREHGHGRDDLREAVGEVGALPGEELHAAVGAPGHDPEAVVLDLRGSGLAPTAGVFAGRGRQA